MKKRLLVTIFAAIAAATCTLSFTACGEDNAGTKGLEYELNEDGETYSVKYSNNLWLNTEIKIPSTYEGKPVTAISKSAFNRFPKLKKITIPDSVTYIGSFAFEECRSLASIKIPDSVTYIGYEAFVRCTNLADISFPDNVTYMGQSVLYNTAYYFNEDNWKDNELYNNKHLLAVQDSIPDNYEIKAGTLTIAGGLFRDKTNLTSVKIPDSVKSIGESAFEGCTGITSITIPDGVTSIYTGAFYGCTSLESIIIPDSITSIGAIVFHGCNNLTDIYYSGSEADWENINIPMGDSDLTSIIHYNYKG